MPVQESLSLSLVYFLVYSPLLSILSLVSVLTAFVLRSSYGVLSLAFFLSPSSSHVLPLAFFLSSSSSHALPLALLGLHLENEIAFRIQVSEGAWKHVNQALVLITFGGNDFVITG
ncbi:hypothetical protein VNO80_18999 [Phaseolus coccineus]|uniref:Uncharacterized protein n=1 Tax=Phaseolus coccineus TaxID=3886 RepID=A0AAN9MF99_PHACN